ncbi:MAG: septal ring lytic transglycosylase RlpA family protein [Chlorobiaceae bacterium]|nr:septal ring lytic transglycosylase RlpA family protein [Chlorobiaceae bacterium]
MRDEKRNFTIPFYALLIGVWYTAFQLTFPAFSSAQLPGFSIQSITNSQSSTNSGMVSDQPKTRALLRVAEGKASYYSNQFHGRRTANGETFDMNELTAAHPSLPFGTWVRVINLRNGKDVVVRINDRGPFVRGRIIDLSIGAAKQIGLLGSGTANVRIEPIGHNPDEPVAG